MTELTIPGLALGLAVGLVAPVVLTLALRRLWGAAAVTAAAMAGTAVAALGLGALQGEPSALTGAMLFAPGVQAVLSGLLLPRGGMRWLIAGMGAAWLLALFAVFGGL